MSEMVERVAKAIGRALSGFENQDAVQDAGPANEKGRPFWKYYENAARAAIAAMREPTEAMCVAATAAESLDPSEGWADFNVKGAWQAMIDEALK